MSEIIKKGNVIDLVVKHDLCSGCGVCVACCPGKFLTMGFADNGDLTSCWAMAPCLRDCGICIDVCPFSAGVFDPRPLSNEIFGQKCRVSKSFHNDVGLYSKAFVGHALSCRDISSSGGLLTWTLENLMTSGFVDRVAVVACEPDESGGYRFVFKAARTPEEIRRAGGSVYHQVEISNIIELIKKEPHLRWAITGVPCLCAALRRAMQKRPFLNDAIKYIFGLACGMYQNSFYTKMLLATSGLNPDLTIDIKYRLKAISVAASNFRFQGTSREGDGGKVIHYKKLPSFLGMHGYFRCNSCNNCMDVFAENADACFMDAWLPDYQRDFNGNSIVLTREPLVQDIIEKGIASKQLCAKPIDIDSVVQSQRGHVYRKRHLIWMRQGEKIDPSTGLSFTYENKIEWFLQRYIQRRSKAVWKEVGGGLNVFWLRTWDIILMVTVERVFRWSLRHLRIFTPSQIKIKES